MSITLSQSFELITCFKCGVPFAVPSYFNQKRREDHQSFFCPNGHSQAYVTGPIQKLERELAEAHRMRAIEANRRAEAEAEALKAQRAKRRLEKRIAAGVCPCCNRTFQDLQRHMSTKHKDYAKALPPGDTKLLTGAVQ